MNVGFFAPLRRLAALARCWPRAGVLQPLALSDHRAGRLLAVASAVAIVAITGVEAWTRSASSLGALLVLPVAVAAWLLRADEALLLTAAAVAARVLGLSLEAVHPGTAAAEAFVVVCVAGTGRLAAVAIVARGAAEAEAAEQSHLAAMLEQRDRIGARVSRAAVRRLFQLTLRLQAAAVLSEQPEVVGRLREAIAEVDELCSDMRGLVFEAEPAGRRPRPAARRREARSRPTPSRHGERPGGF